MRTGDRKERCRDAPAKAGDKLSLYRQSKPVGCFVIDSLWESGIMVGAENFTLMADIRFEAYEITHPRLIRLAGQILD